MSLRRFVLYFMALSACAVTLFPRLVPPATGDRQANATLEMFPFAPGMSVPQNFHKKYQMRHKSHLSAALADVSN